MLSVKELQKLSSDDCNLYYGNTYVRRSLKGKNEWQWVLANSFLGVNLVCQTHENGPGETCIFSDYDWDLSLPEARVYNFRGHTVQLCRTAFRQNRKGLCSETMVAYDIFNALYGKIIPVEIRKKHKFNMVAEHLNVLLEEMNPISAEKSLLAIAKQQALSRALNEHITLSQGVLSKNPTLWYQDMPIGEFCIKTDEVILKVPDFACEVEELFEAVAVPVAIH